MVVKGWYGILIGKTRNKKEDTKDKEILCLLYQTFLKDEK